MQNMFNITVLAMKINREKRQTLNNEIFHLKYHSEEVRSIFQNFYSQLYMLNNKNPNSKV